MSYEGRLLAGTRGGKIFDVSDGGDFSAATPVAFVTTAPSTTQFIAMGTAPVSPLLLLVELNEIPVGDVACEFGGARVDVGYDDGYTDGTPRDGTLQPGEVTSTALICNGN